MATDAIIHTTSRVIRRLTTDPTHVILADESRVTVPDSFNISGGPWKLALDNVTKLAATAADIDDGLTATIPPIIVAIINACAAVEADALAPATVKTLAQRLRQFFARRLRID